MRHTMNHYFTNAIIVTAMMGCTPSSVQQTYQNNYVYLPTLVTETQNDTSESKAIPTKPVLKPIKTVTLTLCPVSADAKAIVLPPLVDFSKTTFRSHREALQAMAGQVAELRRLVREHNEISVKSLGCKPYKVLVE